MTTAVVPEQNTTLSLWDAPEGGWESDGNEDILPRFPMITLVQPMAKEGTPGEFFHTDTGESTKELDIVILVRRETRALFEEGSEKPICRSDDGRVPAQHQPLWDGRTEVDLGGKFGRIAITQNYPPSLCTLCPFSRWGEDGEPPACGNSYVLLVDRGNNDLAQLRIKGTSIKPYRDFVASKVSPKGRKIFWFRIKVTSALKTGPSRKWYEMVFNGSLLSQGGAESYNAILRAQKARFEETVKAQGDEVEAWVEPDEEPSAWMAELLEILGSVGLTMRDVQAFLPTVKADEANIKGYMARTKLADISEFVAAVEAKFIS